MTTAQITDPYMLNPTLTADGRPFVQRCFICKHTINYLKMSWGSQYVKIGDLVSHKKCKPEAAR